MRALTKKKEKEAFKKILANAIIAWDLAQKFEEKEKIIDTCNDINNNLVDAAYFIGGADLMVEAGNLYVKYICKEDK